MFHRAIYALALFACSQQQVAADVGEPDGSVPVCSVAFTPETDIASLVESAATQWSEATGCDVWAGDGGIPVRFVPSIVNERGETQCGVTHRLRDESGAIVGASGIDISTARRCRLTARDVLHEMGHGLAPQRGHTTEGLLAAAPNGVDYVDPVSAAYVSEALAN